MIKFALKRLMSAIPVIWVIITLTFFLVRLAPGGPFDSEKPPPASVLKALNERYHLDKSISQHNINYLGGVLKGDLGPSFKYPGRTVNELIIDGFPASLQLGLLAVFWALIIGILAGVSAAMRPNTWSDYIPSSLSLFGICVPSMLLGPLLVLVFSLYWNWLPVSGWQSWEHRVLPSLTLGASLAAVISRLARSGMLDVLNQDYIRTARAKGAGPMRVLFLHALRGGILPVVSYLGPALASLIAGSFIVETVFQIPGVGRFFVQAATNRDYTVIMGTTIMLSVLIVFFITLSDIVSVWLNPRLSFEDGKGGRS